MAHKYKELFDRINESRKARGQKYMGWAEFLGKQPKEIHREQAKMRDFVKPDPVKKIQRPPAVYSNQSIYDKYGV